MKTLTFDLLAKHVRQGKFDSINHCPIALAIREQLDPISFYVLFDKVRIDNEWWMLSTPYYHTDNNEDFVKYFEAGISNDEVVRTYTLTLQ